MADEKRNPKTLEEQLDELKAQISEIVTKLETAAGKEMEALRPKLIALQERLNELKKNSSEAWDELKPGLGRAWDELHKAVKLSLTKLKK